MSKVSFGRFVAVSFILASFVLGSMAITPSHAQKKKVITVGYFFSSAYEAALYGVKEGKVKSDIIDVKLIPLDISALLQATGTKQYDVVTTAALALPMARTQGLNLVIVGVSVILKSGHYVVVKQDSPIKTVAELKGKTMGVSSIGATSTMQTRLVLEKKYGLKTGLKEADVTLVEVPLFSIPALLETGKIDSAYVFDLEGYVPLKEKKIRILADVGSDYKEMFGTLAATAVWASYPEKVKENPAAFKELMRMFRASLNYAFDHPEEVYPEVGKKYRTDPEFLRMYWKDWRLYPNSVDEEHLKTIEKLWQLSKEAGYIKDYPPINDVVLR